MSFWKLFLLFIAITICNHKELRAQNVTQKTHRILILLDGSHYMSHFNDKGRSYFTNAAEFITHLIDSSYTINEDLEYGLRVYGHQYNENDNRCNDSRFEVRFTKDNLAQISLRLRDLKPKGNGNATYAIQQAYKNEMVDTQHYWYSIIWITADTGKCNTNPCTYIRRTVKNDLYKLFNIQLVAPANKAANCFEPVYIATTEDEMKAIASIIPYYRKDRKTEAYWDIVNRQKPKQAYLPISKPTVTQPIVRQKTDTIITLPPKIASSVGIVKKDFGPNIGKATIPAYTPHISQQFNDSVTALNTIQTRSVELKTHLTRVKAGTINVHVFEIPVLKQRDSFVSVAVPAKSTGLNSQPTTINTRKFTPPRFIPPTLPQSRDSVALINSLRTKHNLNKQITAIVVPKITIPSYHPPAPIKINDSVAFLRSLHTKVDPIIIKTTITTRKVKIPAFNPAVSMQFRDSVAPLSSLTVKPQTKKLTTSTFTPKTAIIPAFTLPRKTDAIMAVSIRFKPIPLPHQPIKSFSKVNVPKFYVLPIPSEVPNNQTEMPPEQPIEKVVDADAVPAIVFGSLNVKSFGATVRVQVYRIKLGEDVLVSDNSFSGPKQIRIKLEPGRYKLIYNLNDGTEVTKPFLIDEDTDTDINVK